MDEGKKLEMAGFFARELLKLRDTINGYTVLSGGGIISTSELCEVGRMALVLIQRGDIS